MFVLLDQVKRQQTILLPFHVCGSVVACSPASGIEAVCSEDKAAMTDKSEGESKSLRPLVVCGPSGVGKVCVQSSQIGQLGLS